MRHLVISLSVALIIGLFCAAVRTSALTNPTPQSTRFMWVPVDGDQNPPGFKRVVGGKHRDGTTMYICRASGVTPGKIYANSCHYTYVGQEYVIPSRYEVLLADGGYEWKSFDELRRSEIKKNPLVGGSDSNGKDTLYICRRHMSDGWHPGKYSYRNNLCYIPWGNQEKYYAKDFEILFPS